MFRKDASARPGSDRASLYDDITDKIIAELEAGRLRMPGCSTAWWPRS
jgi:antirestriction protein ArdC